MLPEYFEFYNPVKLLCGQWSLENIPYELGRLRVKKPLMLVSGTMLQQGILQMMGEPMPMVLESGIPQDSSFELVERLAAHAREEGCDGVVAIGGGSVLDTAKAVRVLLEQEQTALRRLLGSEWMSRAQRVIPFIMVPTTSGTGSECTAVAVVMDEKNGCKQEIVSDRFLPDVAVLDPRCTEKLPPRQTAACGMDALVHAMEAYTCRQKNPLSDAYASTAVEMIGKKPDCCGAAARIRRNIAWRWLAHRQWLGWHFPIRWSVWYTPSGTRWARSARYRTARRWDCCCLG